MYRFLATEVSIIAPSVEVLEVIPVSPTKSKVWVKIGLGTPNNNAVNFETMFYGFDNSMDVEDWVQIKMEEYKL